MAESFRYTHAEDGFYQEELQETSDGPKKKQTVLKKIPTEVIKNARGLAIFTTMRTGLWVSGAGGSGILVGRTEDGSWSGPCGIMLHTAGLGFLVGVDIYDCVLVLNTDEAVRAFAKWRCTIGGEISAVAGPAGVGGVLESEVHRRQAPVFNYLKSRGFYAGVQIDGTVIIERNDENARFYGTAVSARDIVAGKTQSRHYELRMLNETLRSAQGERNIDKSLIPSEPPPADYQVMEEGKIFGIPAKEDPDPFGVLALEREGLQIREAGTKMRASSEQFDFKPNTTSPIYETFRRSLDSASRRGSWRSSTLSSTTKAERSYATSDVSTQTDLEPPSALSPQLRQDEDHARSPVQVGAVARNSIKSSVESSPKKLDEVHESDEEPPSPSSPNQAVAAQPSVDIDDDAVIVHEVRHAPQAVLKPRVVDVPKRIPPKLPPRNPGRGRFPVKESNGSIHSVDSITSADERQKEHSAGQEAPRNYGRPTLVSLMGNRQSSSSRPGSLRSVRSTTSSHVRTAPEAEKIDSVEGKNGKLDGEVGETKSNLDEHLDLTKPFDSSASLHDVPVSNGTSSPPLQTSAGAPDNNPALDPAHISNHTNNALNLDGTEGPSPESSKHDHNKSETLPGSFPDADLNGSTEQHELNHDIHHNHEPENEKGRSPSPNPSPGPRISMANIRMSLEEEDEDRDDEERERDRSFSRPRDDFS